MNSEIDKNAEQQVAGSGVAAAATKSKIPMIVGLAIFGAAAIYGGRMLLDAQVPKSQNEFVREVSDEPSGMEMNPKVGRKPKAVSADALAAEEAAKEAEAEKSEDEKEN